MSVDMSDFDVNERVEWSDWGTQTIQALKDEDELHRSGPDVHLEQEQNSNQNLGSSQHSLFWDTLEARAFASKQRESEGISSLVEKPRAGRDAQGINRSTHEPSSDDNKRFARNAMGSQQSDQNRSNQSRSCEHESTSQDALGKQQSYVNRSNHKPQPKNGSGVVPRHSLPQCADSAHNEDRRVEQGQETMDMSDFDVNDRIEWADWGTQTMEDAPAPPVEKPKSSAKKVRNQELNKKQENSSSPKSSAASLPEWTDWGRQTKESPSPPAEQPKSPANEFSHEEMARLQRRNTSPKSAEASLPAHEHSHPEGPRESNNHNSLGSQHSLFWDTYEAKRFAQVEQEENVGRTDLRTENSEREEDIRNHLRECAVKARTPDPEKKELSKAMLEQAESELEAKLLGATFASESPWPLFNLSKCEPALIGQRGDLSLHKPDESNRSHGMNGREEDGGKHQDGIDLLCEERARSSPKVKDCGSLPPQFPCGQRSDLFNTKQRQGLSALLREATEDTDPSSSPSPRRGRQRQSPGGASSRPPIPKRRSEERSPNRGLHNQSFTVLSAEPARQNRTSAALEGEPPKMSLPAPEVPLDDAVEMKSPNSRRQPKSMSPRRMASRSNPNEEWERSTPGPKRRPSSKNETRRFNEQRQLPSHELDEGSAMVTRTPSDCSAGQQSPSQHRRPQQAQQEQIVVPESSALERTEYEKQPDLEQRAHQYCKPEHLSKTRWRHLSNTPVNAHDELEEIACVLRDVLSQVEPLPVPEQPTPSDHHHAPAQPLDLQHLLREDEEKRRAAADGLPDGRPQRPRELTAVTPERSLAGNLRPGMQLASRMTASPVRDLGHVPGAEEYRMNNLKAAKQIKARMEGGVRNCLSQGTTPVGNETQVGPAKAAVFARERAQDAKEVAEQMHKQALQQAAAQARRDRQNVMRKMQELENSNLSGVIQHREGPVREKQHQMRRGQKI